MGGSYQQPDEHRRPDLKIKLHALVGCGRVEAGAEHILPMQRTPTDILRERYARGEIDREEFMQRLENVNEH